MKLTNSLALSNQKSFSNHPYILSEEIFGVHVLRNMGRYHLCVLLLVKYH